jgi:pre-mRNA-splicing helicase BRR2
MQRTLRCSRCLSTNCRGLQVFSALFGGKDNVLVCAPAGSGKEVCAEFALLALINEVEAKAKELEAKSREGDDGGAVQVPKVKAVYVASMAVIVEQVKALWETRFGPDGLGLNVVQLTGEQQARLCTHLAV